MSRITSQGTVISISDNAVDVEATALGIVSATKAKPCTITLAVGTAPVVGSTVVPRNTGWSTIEGRAFRVSVVAGQVITLEDSNTTRELADIKTDADTPSASVENWSTAGKMVELCRSNFNLNNPAGATIDVTTLCDEAHRIVPGLPAVGTWSAAGFYDQNDTAMFLARDAYRSGETVLIDVRYRDGSGVMFMGTVNTFDLTMGINAAVTNNLGGNVDGLVSFYKTPPTGFVPLATTVKTVGVPLQAAA
jgi:hypothetical protein